MGSVYTLFLTLGLLASGNNPFFFFFAQLHKSLTTHPLIWHTFQACLYRLYWHSRTINLSTSLPMTLPNTLHNHFCKQPWSFWVRLCVFLLFKWQARHLYFWIDLCYKRWHPNNNNSSNSNNPTTNNPPLNNSNRHKVLVIIPIGRLSLADLRAAGH